MTRRRLWAVLAACALAFPVVPAAALDGSNGSVITVPAGAVARITLKSYLPLSGRGSIDILGASSGDVAGAGLLGPTGWGVKVSALDTGCRYAGKCVPIIDGVAFGTDFEGKVFGLRPGAYDLVILGRPGSTVSLRLRNGLGSSRPAFRTKAQLHVTDLQERYPSLPDEMPEAYFDEQLTGTGRNMTVLVMHLQAGRPKTLQFDSCLRQGPLPAVQIPHYGSACMGDAGTEAPGGSAGAASVGGNDCTTVPPPLCLPLTTDAVHWSVAYAQAFTSPPHVSVTADIAAAQSDVRATALSFSLN
jgi:hypothetical protein